MGSIRYYYEPSQWYIIRETITADGVDVYEIKVGEIEDYYIDPIHFYFQKEFWDKYKDRIQYRDLDKWRRQYYVITDNGEERIIATW